MTEKINLTYIISNISKVIVFEWIATTFDLTKFNLSFIILNNAPTEIEKFLIEHGFACYHINYVSKKDTIRAVYQTIKILRKEDTTILHAHLFDASLVGLLAAKITGLKKRIHTRHHANLHHEKFKKGVLIDNFINYLSTDIIVISKNVQEIVENKERFHKGKIRLIYHGFKLDEFRDVTTTQINHLKNKYALNEFPIIGVISRYVYWKGIEYIAVAFQELLKDFPDAKLVIANAKGPDVEYVKSFLNKIPNKNLLEIVYEKDMPAFYKSLDVFVHTPIDEKSEAFGQIYIEAMAAEIPGVYTLSGIATEYIIHEKNALVVNYKNSDEIYLAIKRYLIDSDFKNKITTSALKDVTELFSLEKMNTELQKLYLNP
jgi:glycosyltransferase involved in cell wall biosynthesis